MVKSELLPTDHLRAPAFLATRLLPSRT